MASSTLSSSEEHFLCSICLEVFSEPVSTPCGHNFCKRCIFKTWDSSVRCKCPLCNRSFSTTPELFVNTLLSEMVSQFKAQSKPESKPVEVFCDVCSEPKLKAVKSCLVCESSFCESHLQPHLSVSRLKKHQLMEPVDNLEDRMCPTHQRPLELFCKTEKTPICVMCTVLEHKNHEYVSLKEVHEQQKILLQKTVAKNQRLLEQRRLKVQEIQHSLKLCEKENQREAATGLKAFTALIESVQNQRDQFLEQLQEKQRNSQRQAQDLLHQLQKEMCELEKSSSEAQRLSLSTDPLLCLQDSSLLPPAGLKDWSSASFEPQSCDGSAVRALSGLEESLQEEIKQLKLKSLQQFVVDVTLDPDTAHPQLILSEDLKQVHCGDVKKKLPDSPQRFDTSHCVLGKQSFSSDSFYFEVQVKGKSRWTVGVAQESINRKGTITLSPMNGFWTIVLRNRDQCRACTEPSTSLSPQRPPQKVGVFVDYGAGLVSFYDVDSADLLFSFSHCSFRERLFPFFNPGGYEGGANSIPLILSSVETKSKGD